ncbi:MAG: TRAP transporter substrate-binding protein DctP [Deltaproteobacteria bacterium]|nr:TRAP transporter substrate-binding protein DctP [Deltaproteobacteria bacterium]
MKKYMGMLVMLLIMLGWSAGPRVYAAPDAKIVVKMATLAPKGSSIMNIFDDLSARILDETKGEVGFKIYWGGVQGDEKDVLRKIKLGQLHGGGFMGPGLGQIVPEVRVTEIPYVFANYDEVEYVRSNLEETMNRLFEEKGFIVLGWMDLGFIYTFSKVPLTSLEVARQQKWWTMEGEPIGRETYKALGIHPISLSITDVATSLSTNLIDCANSTPYGAVAFQWYTRFSYMGEFPSSNICGATVVSKKIWDRISPQSQKIILRISKDSHDKIVKAAREDDAKCLEILKKAGIKVVRDLDNMEEVQFIFDAGKQARENLVGELYSQELLDRTLSLVEEYRKAHPEDKAVEIIQ